MQPDNSPFPLAAVRSMTASPWTLWAARHFGKRITGRDGDCDCVARKWRGKIYLMECKHVSYNA